MRKTDLNEKLKFLYCQDPEKILPKSILKGIRILKERSESRKACLALLQGRSGPCLEDPDPKVMASFLKAIFNPNLILIAFKSTNEIWEVPLKYG